MAPPYKFPGYIEVMIYLIMVTTRYDVKGEWGDIIGQGLVCLKVHGSDPVYILREGDKEEEH